MPKNDTTIPSIETERLLLRPPTIDDFEIYETFFSDEQASRFYGGPLLPHRAWTTLAADLGHWQLKDYGRWAIEVKATREMVGGCGLWWPDGWPRSELTWWIAASARRRGFATEASRAAIKFAYDVLDWDIVETHMDDENEAARNLVLSLGGSVIARETFPDGKARDVFMLPRSI